MNSIITIDGPSASGKTSVARLVAKRLGIPYVSSGLLYRAVTFLALQERLSPGAVQSVLDSHRIELIPKPGTNLIYLDGKDITKALHTLEIDGLVSPIAQLPSIRAHVNAILQRIPAPFVIDGRDMGSAVFPQARHKFYLTAPPELRARRRMTEREAEYEQVLAEIVRRDGADAVQSVPAPDAVQIDTAELNLEAVVNKVLGYIEATP
jgi:cytidylate kinase